VVSIFGSERSWEGSGVVSRPGDCVFDFMDMHAS
jgi:hypothetical protein